MIYIYTKANCLYCTKAKKLLTENNMSYEERVIEKRGDKIHKELMLMDPKATMVPQIFDCPFGSIQAEHVGGYEDLVEWIKIVDEIDKE